MAPQLPKLDPNLVAQKAVDKIVEDPLSVMANGERYLDLIVDVFPTMPWEFPIPIPRGLYTRLELEKLKKRR